ncbi:putative FRE ferric reductase-like transmembrane component [Piedraia hortae CBS 480.64]|uniref:ferric-chelate reductase (NADPH) n=1 Tax=Piedraia hortae CBS 480.64 TaxID=1314780 RepID=A0A6A7BS84_9PEZI|nr:putative FRE ferric reductase-like transmembrane component [Piedraia hortae CBS 480.64]
MDSPLVSREAPGAHGGAHGGAHEEYHPTAADYQNIAICKYTAVVWAAIVFGLLVYRWTTTLLHHIRKLANLTHGTSADGRQRYFSIPNHSHAAMKKHIIDAPLIRKRHNREFHLSEAINVGTLPGRLQTLFLVGYLAMNIVFAAITIQWSNNQLVWVHARNRMGVLATLNMIPLFLLAGRNNPLIWLLGISFDSYNLIHRWIGRIVVGEAVCHAAFWMTGKIATMGPKKGWMMIEVAMAENQLILTGTIGAAAFVAILLQSPSILRHAFYETFLHVHQILVIIATVAVWVHLKSLPQQALLAVAVAFWIFERAARMFKIMYPNISKGVTRAEVEALPGDAVRVTLRMARPWKFHPGQHVYLYLPALGLWTSHPFSVAWSEEQTEFFDEKSLPLARQDLAPTRTRTLSLVCRRRTGLTDRLFRKAEATGGKFVTMAFAEGPYGSQSFKSYGTVMLFAAGIGITHQVPHVRDLVSAYANGTCATRKVILVWIIRSPEHLEWIRPWMTGILGMDQRRDVLKIQLFVTRPRSTKEIHSPSSSVQMFPGKPDVGNLIDQAQAQQVGAMALSVCGTGSLADDVRFAHRERCEKTEIDLYEEAFSW